MVFDQNGLGSGTPRQHTPLHVIPMLLALILAAFLGAAAGMVWQSSELGEGEAAEAKPAEEDSPEGAGEGVG
jgi:hypothetical protein